MHGVATARTMLSRWVSSADQLKAQNALQTNSARVALDTTTGRYQVQESGVTVERHSTTHTACGTGFAIFVFLFFVISILVRFTGQEPSISVIATESLGKAYTLPDIAITISAENMAEADLLKFMWPGFMWHSLRDGFTNRSVSSRLMHEARFGGECNLTAGYRRDAETGDGGSATWPVFCVIGSSEKLQGRFGDPEWNYLQIKLNRCNGQIAHRGTGVVTDRFASIWDATGNTTCASSHEMFDFMGHGIGINMWFRFKREDWKQSGTLQPARGMLAEGGWTWFVYEVLNDGMPMMLTYDLRYNTAKVSNKYWNNERLETQHEWFDSYHRYARSPSGTTSGDFLNEPFLSVSLRVAWYSREVSVRYQTLMEVISEISGSWAISLLMGSLFAMVLQRYTSLPNFLAHDVNPDTLIHAEPDASNDVRRTSSLLTEDEVAEIIAIRSQNGRLSGIGSVRVGATAGASTDDSQDSSYIHEPNVILGSVLVGTTIGAAINDSQDSSCIHAPNV